jgi:hypothetical protein
LARRLADMLDSHDLVLARTWNMFVPEAAAVGLLTLPHLPELRLAVGPVESMLAAANQETRRRVRRCDDQGYRLEVSAGSERFDEFYHDYHLLDDGFVPICPSDTGSAASRAAPACGGPWSVRRASSATSPGP